jgi:hypothetical protein
MAHYFAGRRLDAVIPAKAGIQKKSRATPYISMMQLHYTANTHPQDGMDMA